MKKIVLLTVAIAFLAVPVFAATLTPVASKAPDGPSIGTISPSAAVITQFAKFSKGVYVGAETNTVGYAISTAHTSGTKYYGTASDATALYVKNATTTDGIVAGSLAAPTSSTAAQAFEANGYTKL